MTRGRWRAIWQSTSRDVQRGRLNTDPPTPVATGQTEMVCTTWLGRTALESSEKQWFLFFLDRLATRHRPMTSLFDCHFLHHSRSRHDLFNDYEKANSTFSARTRVGDGLPVEVCHGIKRGHSQYRSARFLRKTPHQLLLVHGEQTHSNRYA